MLREALLPTQVGCAELPYLTGNVVLIEKLSMQCVKCVGLCCMFKTVGQWNLTWWLVESWCIVIDFNGSLRVVEYYW